MVPKGVSTLGKPEQVKAQFRHFLNVLLRFLQCKKKKIESELRPLEK